MVFILLPAYQSLFADCDSPRPTRPRQTGVTVGYAIFYNTIRSGLLAIKKAIDFTHTLQWDSTGGVSLGHATIRKQS